MARTIAAFRTETLTARRKLKPRPKPYYSVQLAEDAALGYIRRGPGIAGSWVLRVRRSEGRYALRTLGTADDAGEGSGLSFAQAQGKSREALAEAAQRGELPTGARAASPTVDELAEKYFAHRDARQRAANVAESRTRYAAHIRPAFGERRAASLRADEISGWLSDMVPKGAEGEAQRRAQATANRVLTVFKAALNHGFNHHLIADDRAWRRVKPFKKVERARDVRLTDKQLRRYVRAAYKESSALGDFVSAATLTGARAGELISLEARHFDAKRGTLTLDGKTGERVIHLPEQARVLFARLAGAAAAPDQPMLPAPGGGAWAKNCYVKPCRRALAAAGVKGAAPLYVLRHSFISRVVEENLMPLSELGKYCGTSSRMIETTYQHVLAHRKAAMIERAVPRLRLAA